MTEESSVEASLDVLGEAWTFAVAMFLSQAPHPEEWTITDNDHEPFALIHIGDKKFHVGSYMEASMLQGCLTTAWFSVSNR